MREWFRVEAAAKGKGGGEILIYGSIGKRWYDEDSIGAKSFIGELNALVQAGPGDIHVRINSPGGDVADGIAIYNALRAVKDRVVCTVDSAAYSMASVIAIAGRETRMQDTGQFMIHKPIVGVYGSEREVSSALKALKTAKSVLIKAYAEKTGKAAEDIEEAMDATTWMTAEEAKDFGFVDTVIEGADLSGIAACFDVQAWRGFYEGHGPMPVDPQVVESEIPAAVVVAGSDDEGGAGAAETGAASPEEKRMKASEIRDLCPGASAEFILAQVEAADKSETYGAVDVLKAWNAEQAKVIAAKDAEKAEAVKAAEAKAPAQAPGVQPLPSGQASEGEVDEDPIAAWETAVAAYEKRGMDRAKAIREVCIKQKDLHASYLRAYNAAVGRNHLAG